MQLPNWSIQNGSFVAILTLIAAAVGILSYQSMPRSEDPSINLPRYILTIVYPGTSPQDMEELIVNPLEDALEEVDDLDKVTTDISEGVAFFRIEASFNIEDWDDKGVEIERQLNTVRDQLPAGIVFYEFGQFKQEDRAVVHQIALTSPAAPYYELEQIAENVEDRLEAVAGVKAVKLDAFPDRLVRVSIDFEKCVARGVAPGTVIQVLRENNVNVPGGNVAAAGTSFSIKTSGSYDDLEAIRQTVLVSRDERLIYLRDVADVNFAYEEERWRARYNGERALLLSVLLENESNIMNVSEDIHAALDEARVDLPPTVRLQTAFEQAPAVKARIGDFFMNLLQGVLLVGVIILLFLGLRPALIVMIVIPLCILVSLALLNGSGFALQQISIAALVLALGLLVDNGIVVVENINDYLKQGLSPAEAAAKGTGEVGWAIVSSTVTTLLAFLPLTQLGGGPGEFLKSLPVTVMLTLGISLLLALTFSPLLASKILKYREGRKAPLPQRALHWVIAKIYRPALNISLRYGALVIVVAIGLLIGAVSLFPSIGVSFFPTADKPVLLIDVKTPPGSDLEETDRAVSFVESVVGGLEYTRDYSANVGHGNPFIYYNRIPRNFRKNVGQILVNFTEWDPVRFYATLRDLRETFGAYAGAEITFQELKNGAPVNAPIELRISGPDDRQVEALTGKVAAILIATEGTINIQNDLLERKTDLHLRMNPEKAGLTNLNTLDFDRTILASLSGLTFDEVSLADGEDYPLNIRIAYDDAAPGIEDFDRVYVPTRTGAQIPLRQVADLEFVSMPSSLTHFDLERVAIVTADVTNADNTIAISQSILAEVEAIDWPAGYKYTVGGEYEKQQSTFGTLGIILILAMLGIFAVLVLQFKSLLQPIIVFSALPLAVTGSFVALWLTGWSFSFFAFVGFVSLSGIVVNNSIILVDYMNQLRDEGLPLARVVREGAERRFVPIVLTTLTTILGLLPLTLQATSLWSPLGWTIIGGMVSSTLLTLLVVPVLYGWLTVGRG
ncbi:efflux RND transporter permease subunit [Neolewinella antarctica]|uniref:Multidrug efflux pump subunit AcrB n=1 Tax=Neolewinella antarctica TaxID=442734 RepID=A0ABX0X8U2_9BACT|nr:efflux RND transporter permease subunit [Neolewinella antarctica]NJC25647.1 multidrug efflux pump subunit AcrB [Neolewinella antarctica]